MAVADDHVHDIKEIIQNLGKVVITLNPNGKKTTENIATSLESLKKCVEDLASLVQKDHEEQADHAKTVREHDDEIDHLRQKSLKGKIIITSKVVEGEGRIKAADQIEREGGTLAKHVIELVKHKYNIDITEDDIASCFHLPKGGIMVTFWKKWKSSPFLNLITAIKSPKNSHLPLYFNFMLTKRRSKLLFNIRKLKQDNKIFKFYSDEDGSITIKVKPGEKNMKVTDISTEGSSKLKTWTDEELMHAFP